MRFSLSAAAVAALLIAVQPLYSETDRLKGEIELSGGSVEYVVHHERGRREWAAYIRSSTGEYLASAEEYLSMSFPAKRSFPIYGREKVFYKGFRVGGTNLGDKVELEYGISEVGKPGLLFHELGHFWFGMTNGYWSPSEETNWLVEGIVSFLPIAMADSGFLRLSEDEYREILAHWGLIGHQPEFDQPVNRDFRYSTMGEFSGFFYIKTFKVQYLIYRELGAEGYRRFLRKLLSVGSSKDNGEIIDLLFAVKPADWQELLAGWVFGGNYERVAYADFSDPDSDGLLSVDEKFLLTDPRDVDSDDDTIPDGRERDLGMNPLRADSTQRVREVTEKHGPFIDGMGEDWKLLPYVSSAETEGDSSVAGYDLVGLEYGVRNGKLGIAVWTKEMPRLAEEVMFDVLVDIDFDGQTDLEFAYSLANPSHTWLYSHPTGTASSISGLKGAANRIFEISIPLSSVGTERFQFLPIIRNTEREENYDEWGSWTSVDRSIMEALERYGLQGDLWSNDSDGDGMPDGSEIEAGLNPHVPNASEEIVAYAPFVDGRDTEWSWMSPLRIEDADGDASLDELDFTRLSYILRKGFLNVLVETLKPPVAKGRVIFDILVDTNDDSSPELEFAFFLDNPKSPWIYRSATKEVEHSSDLKASVGPVIEVSVPLTKISAQRFRILPILHDMESRSNFDEMGSWIEIER